MWKNENIFRKAIQAAINHRARVKEGRSLLQQGKSLANMQTPQEGLSFDETDERRTEYLRFVSEKDNTGLKELHKNVLTVLQHRLSDPEGGTSELEWQRIAIEDKLTKRGLT